MSINSKLLKFHAEFNGVKKTGFNPHFKSQHFTLDEIVRVITPILHGVGLFVMHNITEDGLFMQTHVISEDGEKITSSFPMNQSANPQAQGSAITYYKRYNLCALLNIAEADDDGQAAADESYMVKPQQEATETTVKPQQKATDEQRAIIQEYVEAGKVSQKQLAWLEKRGDYLTAQDAEQVINGLKQ